MVCFDDVNEDQKFVFQTASQSEIASWSEFDLPHPFKRKRQKTSEHSCIPKYSILDGFWTFSLNWAQ